MGSRGLGNPALVYPFSISWNGAPFTQKNNVTAATPPTPNESQHANTRDSIVPHSTYP